MTEQKEVFVVSSEYKNNNHVEYGYMEVYSWNIDEALAYAHQEIKKCADRYYTLHGLTPYVEFFEKEGVGYRLTYEGGTERNTVIVTYRVNSLPHAREYLGENLS